ncbi:MAG TPA: hypothetical protein VFQ63_02255 [Patescibacteria group bacterium]|nr:hypothetical protein [Patescibacteria group bacterium]
MDKFFAVFGKFVLFIVVAGALVGGGIYVGQKVQTKNQPPFSQPTPTTVAQLLTPTGSVSQQPQSTHFLVNGGGVAPFKAYTLSAINGWKLTTDQVNVSKVTLTQGDYQLIIAQGAMGGAGCTFPGQPQAEMTVALTNPVDISLLAGQPLRRGTAPSANSAKANFTVCQKNADGSYGTLTSFGAINYITPLSPSADVLAQMDAMVGSLQSK